jgi:hypothetical protein
MRFTAPAPVFGDQFPLRLLLAKCSLLPGSTKPGLLAWPGLRCKGSRVESLEEGVQV